MQNPLNQIYTKELELPETVFIRDIETRVLQGIVLQSLASIEGICLLEGNLLDSFLGRDWERVKGIHVAQELKKHSVEIRVEINVVYGICIPEKAEEIQVKIVEEISRWTGLHVASVHVVFKGLVPAEEEKKEQEPEVLEEAFSR